MMAIREAIEACGRAARVRAHVFEVEPVSHVEGLAEARLFRDSVNAIAGWAPERIGDSRALRRSLTGVSFIALIITAVVAT